MDGKPEDTLRCYDVLLLLPRRERMVIPLVLYGTIDQGNRWGDNAWIGQLFGSSFIEIEKLGQETCRKTRPISNTNDDACLNFSRCNPGKDTGISPH